MVIKTSKKDWEIPISDTFIYGLIDPRNGELKYIGKTTQGIERFRQHAHSPKLGRNEKNYRKINWIKKLNKLNLKFQVIYLEYCLESELDESEIFYIAYFKSIGCKLLNHGEGGEVTYRPKYTEEDKKQISIRTKLAWQNPEIRQKYIDSHQGRPGNNKGKKFSEQARQNIKESITNRISIIDSNGVIYKSMLDASKQTGHTRNYIRKCLETPDAKRIIKLNFKKYEINE